MFSSHKTIYLDHASSAPLDPAVFQAMKPFLTEQYANPSALYKTGAEARQAIERARQTVATFLSTTPDTVTFSRGGTSSINTALLGLARKHRNAGKHIITSAVEHHAVLNTLKQLESEGFEVTYLPVDECGHITTEQVKQALREDTVLVTIMYANNEIGTIEPIAEIGKLLLQYRKKSNTHYPYFHTDACQGAGSLDMSVERLHADLLSFNGSKIYGPKGVGVLYTRRGVELEPIQFGGGQELGLFPGTEDVAGIVGLGEAVTAVNEQLSMNDEQIISLRDYLWSGIQERIKNVVLNGPPLSDFSPYQGELEGVQKSVQRLIKKRPLPASPDRGGEYMRLPNNLNVSFLGTESESVILYLDAKGIFVSSGSACTTDSDEVSHVLQACGYSEERMKSSIRFSLGRSTTKKDIDYVLKVLPQVVESVRTMSRKE